MSAFHIPLSAATPHVVAGLAYAALSYATRERKSGVAVGIFGTAIAGAILGFAALFAVFIASGHYGPNVSPDPLVFSAQVGLPLGGIAGGVLGRVLSRRPGWPRFGAGALGPAVYVSAILLVVYLL